MSRWDRAREYKCTHKACKAVARILSPLGGRAHNCCGQHEHE